MSNYVNTLYKCGGIEHLIYITYCPYANNLHVNAWAKMWKDIDAATPFGIWTTIIKSSCFFFTWALRTFNPLKTIGVMSHTPTSTKMVWYFKSMC